MFTSNSKEKQHKKVLKGKKDTMNDDSGTDRNSMNINKNADVCPMLILSSSSRCLVSPTPSVTSDVDVTSTTTGSTTLVTVSSTTKRTDRPVLLKGQRKRSRQDPSLHQLSREGHPEKNEVKKQKKRIRKSHAKCMTEKGTKDTYPITTDGPSDEMNDTTSKFSARESKRTSHDSYVSPRKITLSSSSSPSLPLVLSACSEEEDQTQHSTSTSKSDSPPIVSKSSRKVSGNEVENSFKIENGDTAVASSVNEIGVQNSSTKRSENLSKRATLGTIVNGAESLKIGSTSVSDDKTEIALHNQNNIPWSSSPGPHAAGLDLPTKPKQPPSGYDIFFQVERERIVHDLLLEADSPPNGTRDNADRINVESRGGYTLEEVYNVVAKMKDRETNATSTATSSVETRLKLGDEELSRIISQRWLTLSNPEKFIFEGYAYSEMNKYNQRLKEWKKTLENFEAKPKPVGGLMSEVNENTANKDTKYKDTFSQRMEHNQDINHPNVLDSNGKVGTVPYWNNFFPWHQRYHNYNTCWTHNYQGNMEQCYSGNFWRSTQQPISSVTSNSAFFLQNTMTERERFRQAIITELLRREYHRRLKSRENTTVENSNNNQKREQSITRGGNNIFTTPTNISPAISYNTELDATKISSLVHDCESTQTHPVASITTNNNSINAFPSVASNEDTSTETKNGIVVADDITSSSIASQQNFEQMNDESMYTAEDGINFMLETDKV